MLRCIVSLFVPLALKNASIVPCGCTVWCNQKIMVLCTLLVSEGGRLIGVPSPGPIRVVISRCIRLYTASLRNSMPTHAAIGLVVRGAESCIGIAHVWHFRIRNNLGIFRNGWNQSRNSSVSISSFLSSICSRRNSVSRILHPSLGCRFRRSLHESTLDSQSTIGKILSAVISNLFVPHPSSPFALESSNDSRSLGRGVDPDATIFVVHLFVFP